MMKWLEQEAESEVFVWEAAAEIAVETTDEEAVALTPVVLRSAALEALDVVAEEAPAQETSAPAIETMQLQPEAETEDAQPVSVDAVAEATDAAPAETVKTDVVEAVEASANPDEEYIAECIALFHEIYPGGLETVFAKGVPEGMFTFLWGNGPVSGQDSWTNPDMMVLDAFYRLVGEAEIDLQAAWQEFMDTMVERLFPNGYDIETVYMGMFEKGPISGQTEWTPLDYRAYDVVQSRILYEHLQTQVEINPLQEFHELYPDGIAELFPDGYSDDALEALLEGNGLHSGEAEWDRADEIIFEGLLQALVDSGVYPFEGETEYEPLPVVIDDGLVYTMPIVIDDGEWFEDEADYPVMVGCDLMPPPEVVVCTFVNEDLALI